MKEDQYLINIITASRIVKKTPENLKHFIVNNSLMPEKREIKNISSTNFKHHNF